MAIITFGTISQLMFRRRLGLERLVRDLGGRPVRVRSYSGRHLAVATCFESEG